MIFSLGSFLSCLISLSILWCLRTWQHITMHELVYTMTQSIQGTSSDMIWDFVFSAFIPAVLLTIIAVLLKKRFRKRTEKRPLVLLNVCLLGGLLGSIGLFCVRLDVVDYIASQMSISQLIDENYVDPKDVELTFPDKKRNLVYIYLESMEMTYSDREHGGAFDENVIPELTELSVENENFSGSDDRLNGAYVTTGTGWTMGALFGHTAGIPLQMPIDGNAMSTQKEFFPSLTNLGDILKENGYAQYFMIGSEAEFGGRDQYFTTHGDYEIIDYNTAKERKWIPQDYREFWGFEDQKLFENAKKVLKEISKNEEPFNLTLLTVDTHFEDGYVCKLCEDSFGEDQYANVMSCSSQQVQAFIKWMKKQPFYKNTTVVVVGDHLTMDSDFCSSVDSEYDRRVYTSFLNSAATREGSQERVYTTLDLFPTTLASLGVTIPGERLGMGTNLFSNVSTYAEIYGIEHLQREYGKWSVVIESMAKFDTKSDDYLKYTGKYPSAKLAISDDNGILNLEISQIQNLPRCKRVVLELETDTGVIELPFQRSRKRHTLSVDLNRYNGSYQSVNVSLVDRQEKNYLIAALPSDLTLCTTNFVAYLKQLAESDYTVFFSVKDDGSSALNEESIQALASLGLKQDLTGKFRNAYGAVVRSGKALKESIDEESVTLKGKLKSGEPYLLVSQSFTRENYTSSIEIDGTQYSMNERGINIVVYDELTGRVVDSVCFDTCLGNSVTREGATVEGPIFP